MALSVRARGNVGTHIPMILPPPESSFMIQKNCAVMAIERDKALPAQFPRHRDRANRIALDVFEQ